MDTSLKNQFNVDMADIGVLDPALIRRIAITTGCHDCDSLPKVPHAGEVFAERNLRYQLMHNGVKVIEDGYCGSWMTEIIRRLKGHHEPQEEKAFYAVLQHLPAGTTMLELGSFWAYYSLWFRRAIESSKVYLIEPDPHNLEIGKQNFEINEEEGEFFQFSVGRKPLKARPFLCESDSLQRPIAEISVDAFMALVGLNRIDLLLADIQGAELMMLEGAVQSIKSGKVRFLFLSTHHRCYSNDWLTHQRCLEFLREHNAHIIAAHNVTESYSGDGLIVASFDDQDRCIPEIEISKNHPTNSLFRELEYDLADTEWHLNEIKKRSLRFRISARIEKLKRQIRGPFAELN